MAVFKSYTAAYSVERVKLSTLSTIESTLKVLINTDNKFLVRKYEQNKSGNARPLFDHWMIYILRKVKYQLISVTSGSHSIV